MKKKIIDILVIVYVLVCSVFTVGLLIFNNKCDFIIKDYYYLALDSKFLDYDKGTLLKIKKVDDYKSLLGKEVYYFNQEGKLAVDNVDDVIETDKTWNIEIDWKSYNADRVIGSYIASYYPKVGLIVNYFSNPLLCLLVLFLPAIILLFYEIYLYVVHFKNRNKSC